MKKASVVRFIDKIAFTLGMFECCCTPWLVAQYPEWIPFVHTLQTVVLIGVRYFIYKKKSFHYFLLDMCYFVSPCLMSSLLDLEVLCARLQRDSHCVFGLDDHMKLICRFFFPYYRHRSTSLSSCISTSFLSQKCFLGQCGCSPMDPSPLPSSPGVTVWSCTGKSVLLTTTLPLVQR